MKKFWGMSLVMAALSIGLVPVRTQGQAPKTTLYLIATAHLDTQWNWTVQDTIRDFIPKTFHTNFDFFEKYPNYVFSWEGVIHYMWFREYHPDEWAKVQKYVADGRWRLAGSWIDAVDPNMPSPESLFRQALYGQRFYRQEFDKVSRDVYLPDSFGFGFALPSIAVHSGLNAFSTQKLTWGRPIPFPIGRWKGVDGSEVIAALNPGSYGTQIREDITPTSTNGGRAGGPPWLNDPTSAGNGQRLEFRYFGTGDTGGAPTEASVQFVQKALSNPDPNLIIKNTSPDQLAKDLTPEAKALLPVYNDELILKTHGTGCYTSQAVMKRFNRANEILAEAAEKASVAAAFVAGETYPGQRLRDAWVRFLWHQFHDDLTGTSIPQAYQFSWNDELASLNQFAGTITNATSAVANLLDTTGPGIPLVVYNPVSMDRTEPIEATVTLPASTAAIRVTDAATGEAVPAQITGTAGGTHIVFVGTVPSLGYRVFNVSAAPAGSAPPATSVRATSSTLENNRISVRIDSHGDIASIYDKDARHELLKAPIMLELRDNPSPSWPAWEVLYDTVQSPAREYVSNPTIRVIEQGPARAAIEITRKASGSTFVQRVRLAEGGDRVDVENLIDWRSPNTQLKASFPFTASNPKAVYDLGLGTIERTNNEPDKYEVPAQRWANIDDAGGTFGVAVLNDSKYGWDKPDDNTLRLSLLHTPRPTTGYTYQSSNDLGHHRIVYAIAGHAGDWRKGRVPVKATQLNQPMMAFQTTPHAGALGRTFSMAWISAPSGGNFLTDTSGQVAILAMKRAEDSDEVIIRFQERYGRPANGVSVRMGVPIVSAREVNAAEEEVGPFALPGGGNRGGRGGAAAAPAAPQTTTNFTIDLKPYQPRTIALKLQPAWEASAAAQAAAAARAGGAGAGGRGGRGGGANAAPVVPAPVARASAMLDLPFNLDGVSADALRGDGDFDGKKHTIPAELFPSQLDLHGVPFKFGSGAVGVKNVLVPAGQSIAIPQGSFNRVYVLAAAVGGDVTTTIGVGAASRTIRVAEWEGPVGQWWSRLKDNAPALHEPFVPAGNRSNPSQQEIQAGLVVEWDPRTGAVKGIDQIRPAFVKRDEIAWIGTHRHDPNGNEPYVSSYVFAYGIDVPPGTREIRLPANGKVRILAMTATTEGPRATPAGALYVPDFADHLVVPPPAASSKGGR
ncbi:MAG TPA: glycoside hydrolase family 38 C-terminal domain-containing protein [Vicinamibacterales bacterium]|nr:glycoside hydrolase family 38 C-terminal domain-containing protein [Vicinamibacterales bacterium]